MIQRHQKLTKALHSKKKRYEEQLFFVEGEKVVLELLRSDLEVEALYYTPLFVEKHAEVISAFRGLGGITDETTLAKVGSLQSNNMALAIVRMKSTPLPPQLSGTVLALDAINDPGNLGAIIRIADWYGIQHIVCSPDCVDCYNPKVLNSSKASAFRVNLHYSDLPTFLRQYPDPIFGAYMDGEKIYEVKFPPDCIIVMGSESHGIRSEVSSCIGHKINIPGSGSAESLNVSVACAIICDNIQRLHTTQ